MTTPKDPFRGNMVFLSKGEKDRGRTRQDERMCGLKSLWAFKRLLPYCFETIQSDISCVALRTADHTHTDTHKHTHTE